MPDEQIPNNASPAPEAPAASEAPASAPETPSEPELSNIDFLGVPDHDEGNFVELPTDEEVPPTEEPKPEETPPEAAKKPGEEPKAEEPKKEEQPTAPKEKPKEQAAAPQPKAPGSEAAPSPAPEEQKSLAEQIVENRAGLIDMLASDRFALSKEEEDALDPDLAAAIPKMKAEVYYEAMVSTLNHINNLVPDIVTQVLEQHDVARQAQAAFYGQYKALDPAKHGADVQQFAQMFLNQNPQLSSEELFSLVGAAVMAKYGLAAPAAEAPAPSPQPKPQPYQPAPPGGSVKVTPLEETQFDVLGRADADE